MMSSNVYSLISVMPWGIKEGHDLSFIHGVFMDLHQHSQLGGRGDTQYQSSADYGYVQLSAIS